MTLTWTGGATDLDLHVVGPGGGHTFFSQPNPGLGGIPNLFLNVDDTSGPGPEIIQGQAATGAYSVTVDSFSGAATTATATVYANGFLICSGMYSFTASDANAGNGVGPDSASFWNVCSVAPAQIPTLSQWGLILFGMLLLTAMFITIRRRGLPTQMTASLLLLMVMAVG